MTEDLFQNLHFQLAKEDVKKIDTWKIKHGMKSRSEAIRSIIKIATGEIRNVAAEKEEASYYRASNSNVSDDKKYIEELVQSMVRKELEKLNK